MFHLFSSASFKTRTCCSTDWIALSATPFEADDPAGEFSQIQRPPPAAAHLLPTSSTRDVRANSWSDLMITSPYMYPISDQKASTLLATNSPVATMSSGSVPRAQEHVVGVQLHEASPILARCGISTLRPCTHSRHQLRQGRCVSSCSSISSREGFTGSNTFTVTRSPFWKSSCASTKLSFLFRSRSPLWTYSATDCSKSKMVSTWKVYACLLNSNGVSTDLREKAITFLPKLEMSVPVAAHILKPCFFGRILPGTSMCFGHTIDSGA